MSRAKAGFCLSSWLPIFLASTPELMRTRAFPPHVVAFSSSGKGVNLFFPIF